MLSQGLTDSGFITEGLHPPDYLMLKNPRLVRVNAVFFCQVSQNLLLLEDVTTTTKILDDLVLKD